MRHYVAWVLAAMVVFQSCAKEQVVHPPAAIGVMKQAGLTEDPLLVDPVMRVSSRLIAAAGQSAYAARGRDLCWSIAVYDRPARGAFVWPDGAIVVYAGTFRLAETEAGLAALLGHEIVHALASDAVPPAPCFGTHDPAPPLFTYQDELDADGAGLNLMADAGYDPRELLRLWERMRSERQERDALYEHVTYERRMEQIAQRLPEAIMRYERTNRAPQKRLPSHHSR